MKKNECENDIQKQVDCHARLNGIVKKEIIKDYKKKGKTIDFFIKYFEKIENEVNEIIFGKNKDEYIDLQHLIEKININKFVETLILTNVMFCIKQEKIITSLYYSLPNSETEIIKIELNEKLKLENIVYEH